jgi:hypothetical protein
MLQCIPCRQPLAPKPPGGCLQGTSFPLPSLPTPLTSRQIDLALPPRLSSLPSGARHCDGISSRMPFFRLHGAAAPAAPGAVTPPCLWHDGSAANGQHRAAARPCFAVVHCDGISSRLFVSSGRHGPRRSVWYVKTSRFPCPTSLTTQQWTAAELAAPSSGILKLGLPAAILSTSPLW